MIYIFLYGILERISYIFWVIAGFMIVFMAFITGYGVFMRYVMRSPNPYVYVINCILMLGCVILSLAQTQKLRRHLRVDLFDNYLPRGIFAILQNVIGPLLGLVFCIVLIWKTLENAILAFKNWDVTVGILAVPTFPLKISIPICFGLLGLILIGQIIKQLKLMINKKKK